MLIALILIYSVVFNIMECRGLYYIPSRSANIRHLGMEAESK